MFFFFFFVFVFDKEGVVHQEKAPESQTLIKQNYLEVLRNLRDTARRL